MIITHDFFNNFKQCFVVDVLMKMKNKRIEFVLTQNKHEFKKCRLQFDREILQRDKKAMRQNQQHEKRIF